MSEPLLDYLRTDGFADSVNELLPPAALRLALRRLAPIRAVAAALRRGAITEGAIRRFARDLIQEFKPSVRFPHELALAGLATALEQRRTEFAEEYLRDLARLQRAEMIHSTRVARESLKYR